jgi:hypothetical protein
VLSVPPYWDWVEAGRCEEREEVLFMKGRVKENISCEGFTNANGGRCICCLVIRTCLAHSDSRRGEVSCYGRMKCEIDLSRPCE